MKNPANADLAKLDLACQKAHGFIASVQPVDESPLDSPDVIARMAKAAQNAGAFAIRIQGELNVKAAIDFGLSVPVIGIIKRDLEDSPVRITPFLEDVEALARAGAKIVAIDATNRQRPVALSKLIKRALELDLLVMSDCSSLEDALIASELGAHIAGSTLSGYTGDITPKEPDFALVKAMSEQGLRVVAEGRFNTPPLARQALEHGAWAVTIGTALTRLEVVCSWFIDEMRQASAKL